VREYEVLDEFLEIQKQPALEGNIVISVGMCSGVGVLPQRQRRLQE
jgi:hypothetical protein